MTQSGQPLPMASATLVIADDHPIMLAALQHALTSRGFSINAMTATAEETIAASLNPKVQIVITDYAFGHAGDGQQLIRRMRRQRPDLGIIVYSMITSTPIITDILMAGANAFVPKTKGINELVQACRSFLSKAMPQAADYTDNLPGDEDGALLRLSPREREVMRLIARGLSVREIGAHLRRSPKTISAQKCTALAKLGLHGDLALARYLAQRGWLE